MSPRTARRGFRLLGPDGPFTGPRPGAFGGNSVTRIFGRLDCPAALSTLARFPEAYERKRVFFADESAAWACGFRPCGRCMPERYRAWRAERGAAGG